MKLRLLFICSVLSTLGVFVASGASSAVSAESKEGSSLSNSTDHYRCNELSERDFFVKECLRRSVSSEQNRTQFTPMPGQMLSLIAVELQWMEDFLVEIFLSEETSGVYSRWARWKDQDLQELATHSFATRFSRGEFSILDLEIANHEVRSLRAEYDDKGNGSVQVVYESSSEIREVVFGNGAIVSDRGGAGQNAGSFYMGCFIDTPAYDSFRPDLCVRFGFQPSTVSFQVFLPYTPQAVVWSLPDSSCSGLFCTVPISPGQTVYGYAYWVINNIPTGPVGATARYYYEPGGGF